MFSTNCLPSSGNPESNIAFVYMKPNKQDFHFGGIFENRGCFFARKEIEKYFDPYYTSFIKCEDKFCQCKNLFEEEVAGKYIVAMGKDMYKVMGYPKAKPKEIHKNIAFWYSPDLFLTKGKQFIEDFNNFCKEIKNAIEKDCGKKA